MRDGGIKIGSQFAMGKECHFEFIGDFPIASHERDSRPVAQLQTQLPPSVKQDDEATATIALAAAIHAHAAVGNKSLIDVENGDRSAIDNEHETQQAFQPKKVTFADSLSDAV